LVSAFSGSAVLLTKEALQLIKSVCIFTLTVSPKRLCAADLRTVRD
jgi:hypothetical protein